MKRFLIIILVCITFFSPAKAQIDSIGFKIDTNLIPSALIRCTGLYYVGADSIGVFKISDTSDYNFTWKVDGDIKNDTSARLIYYFKDYNPHAINFTVENIANATTLTRTRPFQLTNNAPEVPNFFTPNNDGQNDYFVVRTDGLVPVNLSIYSRNGVLVYNFEAPTVTWDGRNESGSELSEGVYFYVLKSTDGSFPDQTGVIHLYR